MIYMDFLAMFMLAAMGTGLALLLVSIGIRESRSRWNEKGEER